jgi:hypothetical protein
MQVDREIEALLPQAAAQSPILANARESPTLGGDNQLVDVWVSLQDRSRGRFHDVHNPRIGVAAAQRANERRREDNVADEPQADQEDLRRSVLLDGRLVNQHHRDVVLDGVDAMTLIALETGAVMHQFDRRFAMGTGEDFEQFGVDWHGCVSRAEL